MSGPTLAQAAQECWQIAEDHGFHGVSRTFGDTCTLIHSEISEAYEAFRMGNVGAYYHEIDGKPEGVAVELLDAVIRIFDALINECNFTSAQVQAAFEAKVAFNRTRPHLHGKVI